MNKKSLNVISIGYGRNLFIEGAPDRTRMQLCADETNSFHMVIFTRSFDRLQKERVSDKLSLYPTASSTRLGMVWDAFFLARKIIIENKNSNFIVTTQDPFEAGVVGYLLKKLYGVRLVVQEHGDVFATKYWREESRLNQVRYFVGLKILSSADIVRVVSRRTKEYLSSLGIKRITTLPVAIDTTRFLEANPNSTVRQLFSANDFVLLSVARFVPQKNLTLLLRAFHKAHQAEPRLKLLLVGTGQEEKMLQTLAEELFGTGQKTVVFLAWSDDVAGLMKASDAYVLSSNYEGWGRVLIEAMVTRLPIVTTDVGCVHEVVRQEVHGLVVPLEDEKALAGALLRMTQDTTFYNGIKENLANTSLADIPGTDLTSYATKWVQTLEMS